MRTCQVEIKARRSVPYEATPGQTLREAATAGKCHGTPLFPFFGSRMSPGIFKIVGEALFRLSSGTEPPPQAPDPTRHTELCAQVAIRIGGQTTHPCQRF
ncbi:hypothetical protein NDU88_007761 [Pleurodeles waltl]|uniref:Uncharacterized protein n=1 Tax=Pleurodeles waltl TaxID=8319 RepID=A0AAV7N562_PLEWA|nr:hypothetical protein NDU88_007761 [Pleurodeles waltl]